jgi:hypothetical protein
LRIILPARESQPTLSTQLLSGSALKHADRAWDDGHLDFTKMEEYLAALLQAQLEDDGLPYEGASSV